MPGRHSHSSVTRLPTHNPRALLPVILNVITEATGARGGQLIHEGEEIGWVGESKESRAHSARPLSAGDETRGPSSCSFRLRAASGKRR